MSFRFEEKCLIDLQNQSLLMKYLDQLMVKPLFSSRNISSIYFDNLNKEMFLNSEEGTVPRKKIRIRNYPFSKNKNYFFETKINSVEGKFKLSKIIKYSEYKDFLRKGILDKVYGNCEPLVEVSYKREYYKLNDLRITIDTNITYKKFNSNIVFKNDKILICEFKSNDIKNIRMFYDNNIFARLRISKYCDAIEKLFN